MKNILGTSLISCSFDPLTGYFRNGYCQTDERDRGSHVVASVMSKKFLRFTKSMGNDLSTPNALFNFPGLKSGDRWCLCALRWKEAYNIGSAPFVILEATHEKALDYIELSALLEMRYIENLN
ncbi:MAG: hypothetical protein CMF99_07175 [Candidatus Marinimicrobia bacterium]|nr:hypothetical protein [Candidatus Neomarinimicrobiota bacterium]|tara:strand:+ start:172 stop:540 length:369 start_codon:yes stop_codon:yes gene_type:complete